MGVSSSAFRKKRGGQSALLLPADFQVPLTQSSQDAKAAYLGMVCPELLHNLFLRVWQNRDCLNFSNCILFRDL